MGGQGLGSSKGHPEVRTEPGTKTQKMLWAAWHCDSGKALSLMFSHTDVGSLWNP